MLSATKSWKLEKVLNREESEIVLKKGKRGL